MEIDREMVEYVAELSKLRLTEQEKLLMQQDLTKVLQYMGILNVFRADVARPSFDREKILQNALAAEAGCFKVPQTVE